MMRARVHGIEWHYVWHGRENGPVLSLWHGFAGSHASWNCLVPLLVDHFRLLLVDLPGHGASPVPKRNVTLDELADAGGELLMSLAGGPVTLCGYSMGGRIALHAALNMPQVVSALILLGASPGIEDTRERAARRASDRELAEKILANGIAWFADYWGSLELFATQKRLPAELQEQLRAARLACNPEGLTYALRNFGTGEQEFLGRKLSELTCPVLLLAGELDGKFSRLNQRMSQAIGSRIVRAARIAGAGHAAHIENPRAVAHEILAFVENLRMES